MSVTVGSGVGGWGLRCGTLNLELEFAIADLCKVTCLFILVIPA